jgi:hypothetical protein
MLSEIGGMDPKNTSGNADDCERKGFAGKATRKTMKPKG